MKLITLRQEAALRKQARFSRADPERFHRRKPVVKISGGGVIRARDGMGLPSRDGVAADGTRPSLEPGRVATAVLGHRQRG